MSDLTDFLLARIAEDEKTARLSPPSWAPEPYSRRFDSFESDHDDADREFVNRFDPARVLAECEAKRRIVSEATILEGTDRSSSARRLLHALAAIYADHPDYDEAWRP